MKGSFSFSLFTIIASLLVVCSFLLSPALRPQKVHAEVSCYAIVTPTSVGKNSSGTFTFSVENRDDAQTIQWLQITSPNENFTFTSGSASGWSAAVTSGSITFTGGTIQQSGSTTVTTAIQTGSSEETAIFTVAASENADGSGSGNCDGTLAITTTATPTTSISSVAFSSISDTQATLTFTTNLSATSSLRYGTTTGYGTIKTIDSATTSHSYTMTGLTANTTYHYQLSATDGNTTGTSSDATFTTAATGGVTILPTQVPTATGAPTATPTPPPDTQKPVVTLQKPSSKAQRTIPTIKGVATDNTGVTTVEYTVNAGSTWNRIANTQDLGSKVVSFSFVPTGSTSGVYTIKTRGKDAAGNIAESQTITFTLDVTGPTIAVSTKVDKPFAVSPLIEGTSSDPSGVDTIEYSIDNGTDWQAVDVIEEVTATTQHFQFTPPVLDDGNYPLRIRSKDLVGNTNDETKMTLVIDRLPPRLGGVVIAIGPQILMPQESNKYTTIPRVPHQFTLSFIGGPSLVELLVRQKQVEEPTKIPLTNTTSSQLWTGNVLFPSAGDYTITVHAKDGAGNDLQKLLPPFHILGEGRLTGVQEKDQVTLTVMIKDTTGQFHPWDGQAYAQSNPIKLSSNASFSFFLPSGTYYIDITSPKYYHQKTTQFMLETPTALSPLFKVTQKPSITIFGLTVSLPSFHATTIPITPTSSAALVTLTPRPAIHINKLAPPVDENTEVPPVPGTKIILSIVNTWAPQAPSQIAALQKLQKEHPQTPIIILIPHETKSAIALFAKRGGYTLPFIADPEGNLLETVPYTAIPTHHLIDKSGTITKTIIGLVTQPSNLGL